MGVAGLDLMNDERVQAPGQGGGEFFGGGEIELIGTGMVFPFDFQRNLGMFFGRHRQSCECDDLLRCEGMVMLVRVICHYLVGR